MKGNDKMRGITEARRNKNISMDELAKKLSIEVTVMKGIESGMIFPTLDNLIKMCSILEASPDKLIYNDDREPLSLEGLTSSQIETVRYLYKKLKYDK